MGLTADEHARVFRHRVGDMVLRLRLPARVDQRADAHAFSMPPPSFSARRVGQSRGEGVVAARLDVETVGADAGLAGVAELRDDRAFDGGIHVGVVVHQQGSVAAAFEAEFFTVGADCATSSEPTSVRASEADLADARIGAELGPDRRRVAGDDVHQAGRQTGFFSEHRWGQSGEGRVLGRLKDHWAPRRERGTDLASDHRVRKIPRRDRADDADGLLHDQDAPVGRVARNDVAVDALSFLGEPLDEARAISDLDARFGEWLALFQGGQAGQILLPREDQIEPNA